MDDPAAVARDIIDNTSFVVLGTADADGTPWTSPVYFTAHEYVELYWISRPSARHSRNIAARPEISAVVFDSQVVPGAGQAVYMSASAADVSEHAEFESFRHRFNFARYAEPTEHDLSVFEADKLRAPGGPFRLYRAVVSEHFILDPSVPQDVRTAVRP